MPRYARIHSRWRVAAIASSLALLTALPSASLGATGFRTAVAPYLTLTGPGKVVPLITVGEDAGVAGFTFEGLPDGIGIMPTGKRSIDVFVNHEQSHVPFQGSADIQDSSVSHLSIDTKSMSITAASVAIPASAGYIRFCSSFLAGPEQGFSSYTLFTNEESDDQLPVPAGAPYGADPSITPLRQAGYSVILDPTSGGYTQVAGLGRMNHENAVVVPGGWDEFAILTGDDTFNAPASQFYMYTAPSEAAIWADTGHLWGFQVTSTQDGPLLHPADPFNGANDYSDIHAGDSWGGKFIQVPDDVARGLVGPTPQAALESWSNANNVFQFIRVEDIAYDPLNPRVVYFADTGERRALTDAQSSEPATGRLHRGPSAGPFGSFGNGRVFKMVLNADDPTVVDEFSILLDADTQALVDQNGASTFMSHPDNVALSKKSLMVQEDTSNARVWRYSFEDPAWSVVATVNDVAGESSGIIDASRWFGGGWWMLDVQAHSTNQASSVVNGVTIKREDGQLLLVKIPGS
jgi:hypothetical protein